jgi:hypothetical protein
MSVNCLVGKNDKEQGAQPRFLEGALRCFCFACSN